MSDGFVDISLIFKNYFKNYDVEYRTNKPLLTVLSFSAVLMGFIIFVKCKIR
jgi:hypothetical protein